MPEVRTFCFCLSLRGGVAFAAGIEMFWTMATLTDALFYLIDSDITSMLTVSGLILSAKSWTFYVVVCEILMGCFGFFCLIKSLASERRIYIIPWFVIALCHCIAIKILSLVLLYFAVTEKNNFKIVLCILYILLTLFHLYVAFVVYSFYNQLADPLRYSYPSSQEGSSKTGGLFVSSSTTV